MKHSKEPWEAGRLLITSQTKKWSQEEKQRTDAIEKLQVFSNFSELDQGRSRERVTVCEGFNAEANAKRIALCVSKCAGITNEALEENVIHDSIMLAQKMFDERFEQVTQKKDQMFNLVKVWEVER